MNPFVHQLLLDIYEKQQLQFTQADKHNVRAEVNARGWDLLLAAVGEDAKIPLRNDEAGTIWFLYTPIRCVPRDEESQPWASICCNDPKTPNIDSPSRLT